MISARRATCLRYQDVLLDLVEAQVVAPGVDEALSHLDRCQDCERDLAQTAIVVAALRRIREETRTAEPGPDAWPRLRARVQEPTRRPWQPGKLSGILAGALLVLLLVMPAVALRGPAGLTVLQSDGAGAASAVGGASRPTVRTLQAVWAAEHGRANQVADVTEDAPVDVSGGDTPRGPQAAAADGRGNPASGGAGANATAGQSVALTTSSFQDESGLAAR